MEAAAASCFCKTSGSVSIAAGRASSSSTSSSNATVIIPLHPRRFLTSSIRASSTARNPPKAVPLASPATSSPPQRSGGSSSSSNNNNRRRKMKVPESRGQEQQQCVPSAEEASISVQMLYQNGDPLGRKELGKCVVRWISQGMRAMASDFASAEIQGEFSELRQRLGIGIPNSTAAATATGGLAFVIQAQPYLNGIPMPKGLEALCFKACTHYPTLFDHFQRELRDVLQEYQRKSVFADWRATESWKLLKEFANSGQQLQLSNSGIQFLFSCSLCCMLILYHYSFR